MSEELKELEEMNKLFNDTIDDLAIELTSNVVSKLYIGEELSNDELETVVNNADDVIDLAVLGIVIQGEENE